MLMNFATELQIYQTLCFLESTRDSPQYLSYANSQILPSRSLFSTPKVILEVNRTEDFTIS